MSLSRRIGRFLVIVGVGLIGYFVLTDLAQQPIYASLLIGTLTLVGGIVILITNPAPESHLNPRFRSLNKVLKRDEEVDEKKK